MTTESSPVNFLSKTVIVRSLRGAPQFKHDPNPQYGNGQYRTFRPQYIQLTFTDWVNEVKLTLRHPLQNSDTHNLVRVLGSGDPYWNGVRRHHWLSQLIKAEQDRMSLLKELPKLTKREILIATGPYGVREHLKQINRVKMAESLDRDVILRTAEHRIMTKDPIVIVKAGTAK